MTILSIIIKKFIPIDTNTTEIVLSILHTQGAFVAFGNKTHIEEQ